MAFGNTNTIAFGQISYSKLIKVLQNIKHTTPLSFTVV